MSQAQEQRNEDDEQLHCEHSGRPYSVLYLRTKVARWWCIRAGAANRAKEWALRVGRRTEASQREASQKEDGVRGRQDAWLCVDEG